MYTFQIPDKQIPAAVDLCSSSTAENVIHSVKQTFNHDIVSLFKHSLHTFVFFLCLTNSYHLTFLPKLSRYTLFNQILITLCLWHIKKKCFMTCTFAESNKFLWHCTSAESKSYVILPLLKQTNSYNKVPLVNQNLVTLYLCWMKQIPMVLYLCWMKQNLVTLYLCWIKILCHCTAAKLNKFL